MIKKTIKLKKILISGAVSLMTAIILLSLPGCSGVFYIPGASYGYYINENDGIISVEWSADRKDVKFSGHVLTDGKVSEYELIGWEDDDSIKAAENELKFSAKLSSEDYSDGFSFSAQDYTYIEFDLKIDGNYDLSRINLGGFLENPEDGVFRIEKDYFNKLDARPFYKRHPFSEFFYKLSANRYFTIIYILILGIIIIEILRITVFHNKNRIIIGYTVSYAILAIIVIGIYFISGYFVR